MAYAALKENGGSYFQRGFLIKWLAVETTAASNRTIPGSETKMRKTGNERLLAVDEVRLIADLRIMHAKVHELFEIVSVLKRGHEDSAIRECADHAMLTKDIARVDDIYLWFLSLKEEGLRLRRR